MQALQASQPARKATVGQSCFLFTVFLVAFTLRVGGIFFSSVIGGNPFADGQVQSHVREAAIVADGYHHLTLAADLGSDTGRWQALLGLFWLIPGPSHLYAQLAVTTVGSLAAVNVYLLGRHLHSTQAGLLAALPIIVMPSYVLMHSVVQREAVVLFALTAAAVLAFLPRRHIRSPTNYVLAVGLLAIAGSLRDVTLPVYGFVAGVFVLLAFLTHDQYARRFRFTITAGVGLIVGIVVYVGTLRFVGDLRTVPAFFAEIRSNRLRGRATYLTGIVPDISYKFGFADDFEQLGLTHVPIDSWGGLLSACLTGTAHNSSVCPSSAERSVIAHPSHNRVRRRGVRTSSS